MASDDVRSDRMYTKDHEWAKLVQDTIIVGITAYAVEQLGDITLVNIDVKPGDSIIAGRAFGTLESVKTASDLFSPVSGKIERVNQALEEKPELLNEDCYGQGWLIEIIPSDQTEMRALWDASAYAEYLRTQR